MDFILKDMLSPDMPRLGNTPPHMVVNIYTFLKWCNAYQSLGLYRSYMHLFKTKSKSYLILKIYRHSKNRLKGRNWNGLPIEILHHVYAIFLFRPFAIML